MSGKKVLTADDILNESDSDDSPSEKSSSSEKSDEKK